ncbi:FAD/NAD(P)-binding protein [Ulvibacterium marinum]|uniref:FAD-dependent urate hydroxylase HpyO/Asp monooxygenase CreE-like FAD/NAD(P)-binding domain-containing protein n=1 Tax=Ulvibacterium marinum TaxID=2419782 RepID=A0A3B0CF42_9FLAO|nr:FAD/NAD(P)-binding protein [Ulvibacterium marinum]RKN83498.1 hypothetical protein D7Z94_06685 [Ulvibacterium marinum]
MCHKIAIIGMGPKGLYALERLVNELEIYGAPVDLEILLFESSGNFGSGKIYDPGQPAYLLMNYPNRNIDIWRLRSSKSENDKPSLTRFLTTGKINDDEGLGDRFSSRATVGRYLSSSFNELRKIAENYASVSMIKGPVNEIEPSDDGVLIIYRQHDVLKEVICDQVMVTTGHDSWKGDLQEYQVSFTDRKCDIPFIYPLPKKFRDITSYETVGIKGLGLTFIDAVLALTEGRDGIFRKNRTGTMFYEPSSLEPKKLTVFSRSGMPMVPRAASEGKETYTPTFFTYDNIFQYVVIGGRPDFQSDILPLLEKETELRYYRILSGNDPSISLDGRSIMHFDTSIDRFHQLRPDIPRFKFEQLFRPVATDRPEIDLDALAYYSYVIGEAKKGSESSPFMAAALTWGYCSEVFNSVYSFGGLTAESQRLFDTEYRSKLNRISYGPPLVNAEKVLTLMEHGILDTIPDQNCRTHRLADGWSIESESGSKFIVDTLIDARIPVNTTIADWSPLIKAMQNNGIAREFINSGIDSYRTACPEIDRCGRPVDIKGTVSGQVTFYGTLTEGMTYDNDTLSRVRNNFASDWSVRCMEEILKK